MPHELTDAEQREMVNQYLRCERLAVFLVEMAPMEQLHFLAAHYVEVPELASAINAFAQLEEYWTHADRELLDAGRRTLWYDLLTAAQRKLTPDEFSFIKPFFIREGVMT